MTARLTRLLRKVIAANEEETGLFERNDDDVGFGHVYTDLEQPLEKLRSWYEEVISRHHCVSTRFSLLQLRRLTNTMSCSLKSPGGATSRCYSSRLVALETV